MPKSERTDLKPSPGPTNWPGQLQPAHTHSRCVDHVAWLGLIIMTVAEYHKIVGAQDPRCPLVWQCLKDSLRSFYQQRPTSSTCNSVFLIVPISMASSYVNAYIQRFAEVLILKQ